MTILKIAAIPFRDLPIGDYLILTKFLTKTQDNRDCMILKLSNKDNQQFDVFAPDRLRTDLTINSSYNFIRNLGLKTSKTSGNQYFDYRLAN